MGLFDSIGSALGVSGSTSRGSSTTSGTRTTQKQLSQEAIDKIVYDILASDQGLSALANAENASGGYGSSTKTLMAQDLIAKVAGEIANITAPTVETTSSKKVDKNTSAKTVICTYLATHGYMPMELYLRGTYAYFRINPITLRGYHFWAVPIIPLLKNRHWLCSLLAPIAIKRYEYVVNKNFSITGFLSVFLAEPICYVIGLCVPEKKEVTYG